MKYLMIVLLLHPLFSAAQNNGPAGTSESQDVSLRLATRKEMKELGRGVNFETGLSWDAIREKARKENKYIFLDCFATWCGPCKMMDKDVYPRDSVGEIINKSFVSVRVQCDTSNADQEEVKSWYGDAHRIVADDRINVYPTLLFLSPDGKVMHKGLGYLSPQDFIRLAKDAMDPAKQYCSLLRNYQNEKKDYAAMPYLARVAKKFKEKELSYSIADDYMLNYLGKLSDGEFCTKENLEFIGEFAKNIKPGDRVFEWYVRHPEVVDSIIQRKNYSRDMISYIAYKEEIIPQLEYSEKSKKTPDWENIEVAIKTKFGGQYVVRNLVNAKVTWYRSVQDWKNYTHYFVMKLEQDSVEKATKSPMSVLVLNNCAWEVFQHSDNKEELEKAIAWSDLAISIGTKPTAELFDTKANLLYKLGERAEGLALEGKALALAPKDTGLQETYDKMKRGIPTW